MEPLVSAACGTSLLLSGNLVRRDLGGAFPSGVFPTQLKPKWQHAITAWTSGPEVDHFLNEMEPDRTV